MTQQLIIFVALGVFLVMAQLIKPEPPKEKEMDTVYIFIDNEWKKMEVPENVQDIIDSLIKIDEVEK